MLWLSASICRKLGQLEEAESHLRRVVAIFRGLHLGEAALAAVELVQLLLERAKPAEARQFCRSLQPLLEPLEQNPIIGAAFGELLLAGFRGSFGVDLCKRIRSRIEDARTRRDAAARRRWRALAVVES